MYVSFKFNYVNISPQMALTYVKHLRQQQEQQRQRQQLETGAKLVVLAKALS